MRIISFYNAFLALQDEYTKIPNRKNKHYSDISQVVLVSTAVGIVRGLGDSLAIILAISSRISTSVSCLDCLTTLNAVKTLLNSTLVSVFSLLSQPSLSAPQSNGKGKKSKVASKEKQPSSSSYSPILLAELNGLFSILHTHIMIPILESFTPLSQEPKLSSPASSSASSAQSTAHASATADELSVDIRPSLYGFLCDLLSLIRSFLLLQNPSASDSRRNKNVFNNIRGPIAACAIKEIYRLYCSLAPTEPTSLRPSRISGRARKDALSYLCATLRHTLSGFPAPSSDSSTLGSLNTDSSADHEEGKEHLSSTELTTSNTVGMTATLSGPRGDGNGVEVSISDDPEYDSLMRSRVFDALSELLSKCRADLTVRFFGAARYGEGSEGMTEDEQDMILGVIEDVSAYAVY